MLLVFLAALLFVTHISTLGTDLFSVCSQIAYLQPNMLKSKIQNANVRRGLIVDTNQTLTSMIQIYLLIDMGHLYLS